MNSISNIFSDIREHFTQNLNIEKSCLKEVGHVLDIVFKSIISIPNEYIASCYNIIKKELNPRVLRGTDSDIPIKLTATLCLSTAPNQEAYDQILAQNCACCAFQKGEHLPLSSNYDCPQYIVRKTLYYPKGIKALILVPQDKAAGLEPKIVFSGTDIFNVHNVIDDLPKEIGSRNFPKFKHVLKSELEAINQEYGRAHVLGFSYGGTIAQRLTANYPALIARCTRHNSPGVGERKIEKFAKQISLMPEGLEKPKIVSYRHAKDLPSLVGGEGLPCDEGFNFTCGTTKDNLSFLEVHSFNTLSTGAHVKANATVPKDLKRFAKFLDCTRVSIHKVLSCIEKINSTVLRAN